MARLFDDASSEFLINNNAVISSLPFAMVAWARSNDLGADQDVLVISTIANQRESFGLTFRGGDGGDPVGAYSFAVGTDFDLAVTSSGYSANIWHHVCAIFVSSTDRRVLIDGGSKGVNTDSNLPSGMDTTTIGRLTRVGSTSYFSGDIAEVAV